MIGHHKFKNGHRIIVVGIGRLAVSFFNYWIGFSKRNLPCLGDILNLGFVKVTWGPDGTLT